MYISLLVTTQKTIQGHHQTTRSSLTKHNEPGTELRTKRNSAGITRNQRCCYGLWRDTTTGLLSLRWSAVGRRLTMAKLDSKNGEERLSAATRIGSSMLRLRYWKADHLQQAIACLKTH